MFSSVTQLCLTLCDPMDCSMPGFPVHHQLPELGQTHINRVGDAIQLSLLHHPLLLLPSVFPSIRVFSSGSVLRIRWPKDWSFSFSISPSGLISFPIDKTWSTGEGNGKPLQYSCLENSTWKSFNCVWLSVTPWLYSPWNSPGQNAGVGNLSREVV